MGQKQQNSRVVEDLERRIDTIEKMDDAEFGSFTGLDYLVLTVGAVLLPILAFILAR